MSQKASICVIGLGIGMLHARAYSKMDDVELYLCDTNLQRLADAKAELNPAGSFSSLKEALASPAVRAVDISLPNNLHASVAVEAAHQGKHCFIEKPLATSLSEADRAQAQCKAAGTLLAVAENWQFSATNLKASEMIREGKIGRVFMIDVRSEMWPIYFGKSTWYFDPVQTGGGVLLSSGVHAIRTMRMLSPSSVAAISAASTNIALGIKTEDTCLVTAEFSDGSLGSIAASWATPHADHLFAAHGTEGSIIEKRGAGGLTIRANKPGDENETFIPVQAADTMKEECTAFAHSVLAGKVDDRISFERGRADVEIAEAAYRSASKKERVKLPL